MIEQLRYVIRRKPSQRVRFNTTLNQPSTVLMDTQAIDWVTDIEMSEDDYLFDDDTSTDGSDNTTSEETEPVDVDLKDLLAHSAVKCIVSINDHRIEATIDSRLRNRYHWKRNRQANRYTDRTSSSGGIEWPSQPCKYNRHHQTTAHPNRGKTVFRFCFGTGLRSWKIPPRKRLDGETQSLPHSIFSKTDCGR